MQIGAYSPSQKRFALAVLAFVLALALWLSAFAANAEAKQKNQVRLSGVATTLTTDPDTTTLLMTNGIVPFPIAPSWVVPTADAAKYRFPITNGRVNARTLSGYINHSGGLLLAMRNADNSWTALSLAKFTIRINAAPDLTAVVNGADRVSIANLDLGNATIKRYSKHHRRYIQIANVGVTLNKTATDAIEATFFDGANVLPDNVKLGKATVVARVAR